MTSVEKGKPMSIAHRGFAILASVASLSMLTLACADRDQPLGVPDAAGSGVDAGQSSSGGLVESVKADSSVVFDVDQPSLEGYWDLVLKYSSSMDNTTHVASGSNVVRFMDGVAAHYLDNCGIKICSLSPYSLQGMKMVFVGGNANALVVTDTTLRMTALQAGGLFGSIPGDTLDFVRIATFSPDGYAACQ